MIRLKGSEIRHQTRLEHLKDMLVRAISLGIAIPLGLGVFIGALSLGVAVFEFDYQDYRREQKLMECLKEAKNARAADYCQINWGPETKRS